MARRLPRPILRLCRAPAKPPPKPSRSHFEHANLSSEPPWPHFQSAKASTKPLYPHFLSVKASTEPRCPHFRSVKPSTKPPRSQIQSVKASTGFYPCFCDVTKICMIYSWDTRARISYRRMLCLLERAWMEYRMMSEIDWYVITNSYIQYDLYSCECSNLYKLYSYI